MSTVLLQVPNGWKKAFDGHPTAYHVSIVQ